MVDTSLAALTTAAATDQLERWLAGVADESARARLWTTYPASLASCLLARTLAVAELAALRERWIDELERSGAPWVRPLRPLATDAGLVAELHEDVGLKFGDLSLPRFVDDEVVVLTQRRLLPQAETSRCRHRLRFAWARGEAGLEPDPHADEPNPHTIYPRFVSDGWGPTYLLRAADGPRVALPCPEEGSASARFTADGRRIWVYGTHDEYSGGFAYLVDATTLDIIKRVEVHAPVSAVDEDARGETLLISTYRGLTVWSDGRLHRLSLSARDACLSPDGRHIATLGEGLQIWSLADVVRAGGAPEVGFATTFDPSGERLLTGARLYDGRTGAAIAVLAPEIDSYLEGGPAQPWFHLGTRRLINMHGMMQAWDSRSGAPLKADRRLRFPHWFVLAYDRAGERLAALRTGAQEVALHGLPDGQQLASITLDISGDALAMTPDGSLLAARGGADIELRTVYGKLRRRFVHPVEPSRRRPFGDPDSLRFASDGRRLASFCEGDGWRIWPVTGGPAQHLATRQAIDELEGFGLRPPGWHVEAGTRSLFVHRASGTRIALPAAGPWACNPAQPRNLASDDLHVELRGPG